MRIRRRIVAWLLFAFALAGLGYGLHAFVPQEPRWTLPGIHELTGCLPDGSAFLTHSLDAERNPVAPLVLRDMRTGEQIHSFFQAGAPLVDVPHWPTPMRIANWYTATQGEGDPGDACSIAVNNQHIAVCVENHGKRELRIAELPDGPERAVPLEIREDEGVTLLFSPDGELLAAAVGESYLTLVESRTGKHVDRITKDSWWSSFGFTPGGTHFLCDDIRDDDDDPRQHVQVCQVWDTKAQRRAFSLDGMSIIEQFGGGGRILIGRGPPSRTAWDRVAWDVAGPRQLRIGPALAGKDDVRRVSVDGNVLAVCKQEGRQFRVEFWDLINERLQAITQTVEVGCPLWGASFSPDGRHFAVTTAWQAHVLSADTLFVWEVASGHLLWKWSPRDDLPPGLQLWPDAFYPEFTNDGQSLLAPTERHLRFVDPATGATQTTIPWGRDCDTGRFFLQRLTRDRRFCLVDILVNDGEPEKTWWRKLLDLLPDTSPTRDLPELVVVVDVERQRELFRLRCPSRGEHWVGLGDLWLTDDGRSLLVLHRRTGIETASRLECWDVPTRKPLRWVFGFPMTLGGLAVGLRCWRNSSSATRAHPAGSVSRANPTGPNGKK